MSNTADIDWELLAEHLDGGLAGTPEGERVAQLVATDPSWAAAAAELATAVAAVTADLASLPPASPMPEDVAARLEAALASVPPAGQPAAPAARPAVPPAPAGRPPRGPEHTGPAHTGPAHASSSSPQRRRRRARWGAGIAAAGAVVAFAAIGLGSLGLLGSPAFMSSDSDDGAAAVAGADGERAEAPALGADQDRPPMIASGTDYQPGSPLFRSRAAPVAPQLAPGEDADRTLTGDDAEELATAPDPALDRLWVDPWSCLAEVVASHEPAPATIKLMDFGTFQGEPAIVIWVTTADEAQWVTVAGPDCGVPAAGPDELHRAQLG